MNLIDAMNLGLMREDASEFVVMAGRPPCVKVASEYKPIHPRVASEDDVLEMLVSIGGLQYVDRLGEEPSSWTTVQEGIGPLRVRAARREGVVQARVVLNRTGQPSKAAVPLGKAMPPPLPPSPPKAPPIPGKAPPVLELIELGSIELMAVAQVEPDTFDQVKADAVKVGPVKADAVKIEPSKIESTKLESTKIELAKIEPVKIELAKIEPVKIELAKIELTKVEVAKPSAVVPEATLSARSETPTLHELLAEARMRRASDLHIVATRPTLFRIAGELVPEGPPLVASHLEQILLPCIPERCRAAFHGEGSCDFAIDHEEWGRFRVNVSRQRTGLKASLRLIGRETPSLESLGLPAAIGNATHHHQGLIVITGPTGHGKTTTLAAIIDLLNTESSHHIITVEDPVEYVHQRKKALLSQREVGTNTRSFGAALKASLREDPDVIVVGELRDTDTVRMALSASETGHLVIATMNTPSAAKTIDRLIDLFPPGDQPQVRMGLAGGLRLIVSQRLVRSVDGTGVFAAAEILPGNIALWNLIRDNKTYQIPSLQQRGKSLGIVRLDDSLGDLVRAGKVTLDEARALAEAPDDLAQAVTGQRPAPAARKAP